MTFGQSFHIPLSEHPSLCRATKVNKGWLYLSKKQVRSIHKAFWLFLTKKEKVGLYIFVVVHTLKKNATLNGVGYNPSPAGSHFT